MARLGVDDAPPSAFGAPLDTGDGWSRAAAQTLDLDGAALRLAVQTAATPQANFHSVLIERHGKLAADFYFTGRDRPLGRWYYRRRRFDPETLHDMRSISRSIVGLLIGIAHGQGLIRDVKTPVLEFLPEYADRAAPEHRAITLEHLLTMTAGLEWDEGSAAFGFANSKIRMSLAWDRYRYILSQPVVKMPGSRFSYSGGATALLGGVLERVSGLSVPAFADAHLFGPLGITEARWITDLRGKALVFSGLRMRPRDLARIGRLLLDNGRVLEREVVPAAWIAQSFAPHVATGDGMAFGYHWWVNNGGGIRERWTAAFGNGGQRLYMVPALDLVVVMTAGRYNQSNHGRIAHELFRRIVAAARA